MDFPSSGQVWLDGTSTSEQDGSGLTCLRREKAGFVFQSFQLLNTMTVLENVEPPLLLSGESPTRKRARSQLELVELGDLGSRMPHQLSGGRCFIHKTGGLEQFRSCCTLHTELEEPRFSAALSCPF